MKAPTTAILLVLCGTALAQAPTSGPANTTAICKDGTYSTAPTPETACKGHKGIHTWYKPAVAPPTRAASLPSVAAPVPAAAPVSVPPPAPAKAPKGIAAQKAILLNQPPAPGGGPGLVWLNATSKVYHCPASEFYGKTKSGSYLPEADAEAKGAHPAHGKPCSQAPSTTPHE